MGAILREMGSTTLLAAPLLPTSGGGSHRVADGVALFDDVAAQIVVAAMILTGDFVPLTSISAGRRPGMYALRYHGKHKDYQDLRRTDILYVGKGGEVSGRLASHACSFRQVHDLEPGDFSALVIPTPSLVHAEVAEALAIGAFDPIWNRKEWSGLGSRPQGVGRAGQRPTKWDARHPGRADRNQP